MSSSRSEEARTLHTDSLEGENKDGTQENVNIDQMTNVCSQIPIASTQDSK